MTYMKSILFLLSSLFFSCTSCTDDSSSEQILALSQNSVTLEVGEKTTLTITEAPTTTGTLSWSSEDDGIATVFFGEVTALKSGTTTILAQYGDYTDTCQIIVPERHYELVWSDEFDGTELNMDNWSIEVNGSGGGNNELQYYTDRADNIRVEDGLLTIEAKKETYLNQEYTSGRIKTAEKQEFQYGKVEVRLKVPAGTGTWPAFWMLGNEGSWPECGEIDIMEHVGYEPYIFHTALHTLNKNGMNGQNFSAKQTLTDSVANDFHIITMEWVENETSGYDRIHIYVDGVKTTSFGETAQLQASGDWPFNKPFYFIVNLAIGGSWGGVRGVDDTIFEQEVLYQLDYVRVYQLQ